MPPAPSYPSPNAAQMGQGTMQYYNRQLTTDELLSAELSREASGANLQDGGSNGLHHGQPMVLGPSNPGAPDMGRPQSADQQQQHMLQFTPNQQVGVDPNHDLSYGDQSARRKRSKVSRACDECRRKKVRCDATSESGVETCSNCRRLGVNCQFSRVPMKRGPSKGYIKELAERLNTLESQMQPAIGQAEMQYPAINDVASPRGYQEFSPPMDGNLLSRKRTFSMSENFPTSSFPQGSFMSRAPHPGLAEHSDFYSQPLHNGTGSVPKATQPFWANEHGLQDTLEVTDEAKMPEDNSPAEVDEGSLNAYYQCIHPMLGFLPDNRERFLEILHQCPREVQEALLYVFYAVTDTNLDRVQNNFKKVFTLDNVVDKLWHYQQGMPPLRDSIPANMVWMWTLICLVLECDARGPESIRYRDPLQKSVIIQFAIRHARALVRSLGELNPPIPYDRLAPAPTTPDGDLACRAYATLAVLSRWHDVSVGTSDLFATNEPVRYDPDTLGSGLEHTFHLSEFLPHITEVIVSGVDLLNWSVAAPRVMSRRLGTEIQRVAALSRKIPGANDPNSAIGRYLDTVERLIYWFLGVMVKRQIAISDASDVLYPCQRIIEDLLKQMTTGPRMPSPFDLHALALSVMSLLEATDLPEHAKECWEWLDKAKELIDLRHQRTNEGGEFSNIFATPVWDAKIRTAIERKQARAQTQGQGQGTAASNANTNANTSASTGAPPVMGPNEQRSLQHLADLAVGAEGSAATNAASPPISAADGNAAGSGHPGQTNTSTPGQNSQNQQSQTQPPVYMYIEWGMLTKKGYLNIFAKY
ncbi:transcriptional regulator family: Fungal Specific TF [Paecilomyces variotii]|nr:transcriptional regulator family: Fungal Specific TF [Paecilomyces variotii]